VREIEKQELELDVHFSKSKKRWVYEVRRILKDGTFGKKDRRVLKDHLSRIPPPIWHRMFPGVDKIRANREDKEFDDLKEQCVRWLCVVPILFRGRAEEGRFRSDVGWFDEHNRPLAAIQVISLYDHAIVSTQDGDRRLADELRQLKGHVGDRFRNMEANSRAPLRFAWVWLHKGSFVRFIQCRVKEHRDE
jgi:hypothetical protein